VSASVIVGGGDGGCHGTLFRGGSGAVAMWGCCLPRCDVIRSVGGVGWGSRGGELPHDRVASPARGASHVAPGCLSSQASERAPGGAS